MGFRFPMQGALYEIITEVENEDFYGFSIMDWYAFRSRAASIRGMIEENLSLDRI